MKHYLFSLTFITALLFGCTPYISPYHPKSADPDSEGYASEITSNNIIKVYFNAAPSTGTEITSAYVLRHSAEIGLQQHKKYFALYQSLEDAVLDIKTQVPASYTTINTVAYAYVKYHSLKQPGDFSVSQILKQ